MYEHVHVNVHVEVYEYEYEYVDVDVERGRGRARVANAYASGEDAALFVAMLETLEADCVARRAPVGLLRGRVLPHVRVGLLHAQLDHAPALQHPRVTAKG